jgi:GDPmannose 4,6-dehydratase
MMKTALITGITGQDGSYLAELLLEKGYDVTGLVRRSSTSNYGNIDYLFPYVDLVVGDMCDMPSLVSIVKRVQPDEVYNLAAMSYVKSSWDTPVSTMDTNACGVIRLLEAVRNHAPDARVYQASSSEMFGQGDEHKDMVVFNESTPFHPRSPYGVSKVAAYHAMVNYRESYGMFCANGICFNHESPRRGEEFVTRKISKAVARLAHGEKFTLRLGNGDARRDWGSAKDYVKAMWMILQADKPDDFVIATASSHSVKDFVDVAFEYAEVDQDCVEYDTPENVRPADIRSLTGDYTKIFDTLGWKPTMTFEELVIWMVQNDYCSYSDTLRSKTDWRSGTTYKGS